MIQVGLGIARLTWTKAMIWNFSCQWRTLTRTWASFEASLRADVQFFLSSFWNSESTPSRWWIINANKNKHWKIGRGFQLSWNLIPINFDGTINSPLHFLPYCNTRSLYPVPSYFWPNFAGCVKRHCLSILVNCLTGRLYLDSRLGGALFHLLSPSFPFLLPFEYKWLPAMSLVKPQRRRYRLDMVNGGGFIIFIVSVIVFEQFSAGVEKSALSL